MAKYRKKPVVIEAEQFRTTAEDCFLEYPVQQDERGLFLIIPTPEGDHRADVDDWIITGVKGERYPCKPDIFALTYDPA